MRVTTCEKKYPCYPFLSKALHNKNSQRTMASAFICVYKIEILAFSTLKAKYADDNCVVFSFSQKVRLETVFTSPHEKGKKINMQSASI